ncbi:MAG: hypothetical protein K2K93_05715, partial [Muribaculaceae bacterium]|nr:hypothetical protein [Muribaculaceae bacterium]
MRCLSSIVGMFPGASATSQSEVLLSGRCPEHPPVGEWLHQDAALHNGASPRRFLIACLTPRVET